MTFLHQPPKRTIPHANHNGKSLSGEAIQSSWVTLKKRDYPRPLPMLTIMGSHVYGTSTIWTIFRTGKCLSFRNLNPLSKQERICPSWTIFQSWKWMFSIICQCSLPTWRVIIPFQLRELFLRSPSFPGNMKTLFWREVLSQCMLSARQWGYTRALPLLLGLYLE